MVAKARISKPRSTKGSQCADAPADWEASPSMAGQLRPSFQIPFAHYALIYMDDVGELNVAASPSIHQGSGTIFTQEVQQKFIEMVGSRHGSRKPTYHRAPSYWEGAVGGGCEPTQDCSLTGTPRPEKRRRCASSAEEFPMENMTALRIGDSGKIHAFYTAAFRRFHQGNCRILAKEWIRFIEPKKQVRYPYKGDRETGDPELTKPPWWPAGVLHKEPDHVRTEPRVRLLIHILCNLGKSNVTAKNLKEVADSARRRLTPSKVMVLDEIFKVRMVQERFERGEVDPSTVVYVHHGLCSKSDRDGDFDDPETKIEGDETGDGIMPSALPVSEVSMPAPGSFGMGSGQSEFCPTVASFDAERQPRHAAPSFYSTSTDYTDNSSAGSAAATPATSVMSSPHEQATCDYLMTTPFFTPSTEEQIRASHRQATVAVQSQPGQVGPWAQPFQHNLLSPVDFGTGQAISQPSMHHSTPVTAGSPMCGIGHPQAHGFPDMSRARMDMTDARGPPFRTGSLAHPNINAPHDHSAMTAPSPVYYSPGDGRSG